jgi:translation initiation factor IF-3
MRISRKRRPEKLLIPVFHRNEGITVPEVRVVDAEGKYLGVMPTADALRLVREKESDLVEINPKSESPVAQIIEFSHFKYQKEKEARKQKANAHTSEVKGIRLSVRIGDHDLDIRLAQAEKFLDRGDKVRAEIILRGREHARPDIAFDVIRQFIARLEAKTPLRFEQDITKQANKVTAIVAKK